VVAVVRKALGGSRAQGLVQEQSFGDVLAATMLYFGEDFDMLNVSSVAQPFAVFLHRIWNYNITLLC